ncbi:glycoprotein-N-acetylgalactosamine 3-beta-galactosyltransferase 1-like [Drosophila serrata]|uniref:glycoprotein-N-acetylgalactosamine 3-beta-galactosyltransferase 1-like n=1 Tax=Drosophila serrata TaxID=7274 RepID=UPI000A1CF5A5|nr:glycoprotein-N-acetylgalactosamine 3-beta-galactosyltransferase 1-like [Drosophila serrata]
MSGKYWNTLCLALGLIMGIGLALLFEYFQTSEVDLDPEQIQDGIIQQNRTEQDLASWLYNETRVLCMVLTMPQNHETKALAVKRTWGRRCNKLIFISSQEDKELGAINVNVLEKRRHLFRKVRKAVKYVFQNFVEDYDWFLKVEDDTFVIMENLRLLLYPYDPEAALYFGHRNHFSSRHGNKSLGSSYVMSREALRRLHHLPRNIYNLDSLNSLSEEEQLGFCMRHAGAVAGDARDEEGLDRFMPMTLPDKMPKLKDLEFCKPVKEIGSKSGITIHHVKNHNMMDFLLYRLHVFGVPVMPISLPPKLDQIQQEKQLILWALENHTDFNTTLKN